MKIIDPDASRLRLLQEIEAAQEGGLARPGRPDYSYNLTLLDIKVNMVQYDVFPKPFIQIPYFDHAAHFS
ncbi:hypothetical protein D3C76_1737140 [compost metagenome]